MRNFIPMDLCLCNLPFLGNSMHFSINVILVLHMKSFVLPFVKTSYFKFSFRHLSGWYFNM